MAILIASTVSGTSQCAQLATEESGFHDVCFVDSDTASPDDYILYREAVRLRDEGLSAAEIAAQLDLLKKRIRRDVLVRQLQKEYSVRLLYAKDYVDSITEVEAHNVDRMIRRVDALAEYS